MLQNARRFHVHRCLLDRHAQSVYFIMIIIINYSLLVSSYRSNWKACMHAIIFSTLPSPLNVWLSLAIFSSPYNICVHRFSAAFIDYIMSLLFPYRRRACFSRSAAVSIWCLLAGFHSLHSQQFTCVYQFVDWPARRVDERTAREFLGAEWKSGVHCCCPLVSRYI